MCIVQIGDQTKSTEKRKKTLSPLWDKIFNFQFHDLKKSQLEQMKIIIIVVDKGLIMNSHLGGYEVDLTSVYFNKNHMFHQTWFTLFDFEEEVEGCIGYVKATIEVLGPNDEPTIVESITDDPSVEKTIISPKIRPLGHLIMAEIYRAEYLSPVDFSNRQLDPYVRVKYGGIYKETKKIQSNSNPEFNQIIFLPAILPNHSKDVFIELWHSAFLTDSLIGTAKLPFNRFKNSNTFKPLWMNIYGPPLTAHNEYASLMAKNGYNIGTTFRGRILLRFSSRDEKNPVSEVIPMKYRVPEIIIPNPLQKVYTLRIDIFEGSVLPTKNQGILHFCIGPYMIKSELKKADKGSNIYWYESLPERRLTFPLDISQIPDLIVYFCNEDVESHRISYYRLPAKLFVVFNNKSMKENNKSMIIKFREDKSHKSLKPDQFPGFAVIRVLLFAFTPPPRKENIIILSNMTQKIKYNLLLFVYVARGLASGENDGTSNPQVHFKVGGTFNKTKQRKQTLNPAFYEVVPMEIELSKSQNSSPPTLMILMYHIKHKNGEEIKGEVTTEEDGKGEEKNKSLLGRFWLLLETNKKLERNFILDRRTNESIKIIYVKPQWIPLIYDKEDIIDGKLLMGYALINQQDYEKYKSQYFDKLNIRPQFSNEELTMFAFGVRDLIFKDKKKLPKNVSFEIKIEEVKEVKSIVDFQDKNKIIPKSLVDQNKIKDDTNTLGNFNKEINFTLPVPYLKELCPIMEVFIYENFALLEKQLLGIGQYNLAEPLAYFYKDEEDKDYINKWQELFQLDKMQKKDEGKKKISKIKLQKMHPENQLIYFEDLEYEIKDPIGKNNKLMAQYDEQQKQKIEQMIKNHQMQENELKFYKNSLERQKQLAKQIGKSEFIHSKFVKKDKNFEGNFELITPSQFEQYEQNQQYYVNTNQNQQTDQSIQQNEQLQNQIQIMQNRQQLTVEQQQNIERADVFQESEKNILIKEKNVEQEKNLKQNQDQKTKSILINNKNLKDLIQTKLKDIAEKIETKKIERQRASEIKIEQDLNEIGQLIRNKKSVIELEFQNKLLRAMDDYSKNKDLELNIVQDLEEEIDSDVAETVELSNFELSQDEKLRNQPGEVSEKNLKFKQLFEEENQDAKLKQKQSEIQKWMSKLRIKNPLSGLFSKREKKIEYQEYDTDEEEEYDDVLPYLKGRKEYQDDLEDEIFEKGKKRAVSFCEIYRGNKRSDGGFFTSNEAEKHKVGRFKFLFVRKNRSDLVPFKKIHNFLQSVSKEKPYKVRVYILRGLQITSLSDNDNPKTFLKLTLNNSLPIEDKESEREGIYPEYYRTHEFMLEKLPGTAILKIEIIEKQFLGTSSLLGYTEIDLEERHFSITWNQQEIKPVEKRNIKNDLYGSRGRLEMWIDILPEKNKEPRTVIYPKEQIPYELRVIVWETKECIFKDEVTKANDLFARGGVKRGDTFIETDTHWRCRNKGSFNWRWKFQINLPVDDNKNYGEDKFQIQLWDRDIIQRNDLIGEFEVDLNRHKMLKKAYTRRKAVEMRMRIMGNGQETNMLWFDVYHPEKVDEFGTKISQGKVCLSFEALPKDLSEKFDNAIGRASPNFYPTLPDPVGRFSFDLMSPCKTIKAIIGPDLCYKIFYGICYVFLIIVIIFVGYYVLTTYLGVKVAA